MDYFVSFADLAARLEAGDQEAAAAIVHRYGRRLAALATRLSTNCLEHARRRHRHVAHPHTGCRGYGVGDRGQRRHDRRLTDPAHTVRVAWVRCLDDHRIEARRLDQQHRLAGAPRHTAQGHPCGRRPDEGVRGDGEIRARGADDVGVPGTVQVDGSTETPEPRYVR